MTTQTKLSGLAAYNRPPATYRSSQAGPQKGVGSATTNAVINVRNLRLRTYIGFNPEERVKQQDIVVNIEIGYSAGEDALDDHVEAALDYKAITKNVIKHIEEGHFLLLEKLVSDVLSICSDQSVVNHARVTVDKPHALRFADSVSLTLEYNAEPPCSVISEGDQ